MCTYNSYNTLSIKNKGRYINLTLGHLFICVVDKDDLIGLVCVNKYNEGEISLVVKRMENRLDIIEINYKKLLLESFDLKNNIDEIISGIKYIELIDNDTSNITLIGQE